MQQQMMMQKGMPPQMQQKGGPNPQMMNMMGMMGMMGKGGPMPGQMPGGKGPMPGMMPPQQPMQPQQQGPAPGGGGGQGLNAAALAAAPPSVQKQMIGEKLFPAISRFQPELAGKITGMMLEMDNSELLILLESDQQLKVKVDEAINVLQTNK